MNLAVENYESQQPHWPHAGRCILAQFDDEAVVVYQAYASPIARFAAENQYFGGPFKLDRMSWIKPNFLWMMYRSGWGTKADQEVILAVRIMRNAFDEILGQAVQASFDGIAHPTAADWKRAVESSNVRLQWDPDHDPEGRPLQRRAIQLGLRGDVLRSYSRDWIVGIEDISHFVREQSRHAVRSAWANLITPVERLYPVDAAVRTRLGMAGDFE